MKFHPLLEEIRSQVGETSTPDFLARFRDHFLVIEMKVFERNHQLMTKGPSQSCPPDIARTVRSTIVAVIGKTARNRDADRITVGRSPDNDVIIEHPSVSKLHAFIRYSESTGSVKLSDAGSRFGTTMNGIPVGMGANLQLQSGDAIVFARSVTASYFTPADFYEYLKITRGLF